jgi:hypothetical protein
VTAICVEVDHGCGIRAKVVKPSRVESCETTARDLAELPIRDRMDCVCYNNILLFIQSAFNVETKWIDEALVRLLYRGGVISNVSLSVIFAL